MTSSSPTPKQNFCFVFSHEELNDPDSRSSINTHSPSGALERINVLGVPPTTTTTGGGGGTSKKEFRDKQTGEIYIFFVFVFQIESEKMMWEGLVFYFFFTFGSLFVVIQVEKEYRCR
jgi:hypothetical protein